MAPGSAGSGQRREVERARPVEPVGARHRSLVHRRLVGQGPDRHLGHHLAPHAGAEHAVGRDAPDRDGVQLPLLEDPLDLGLAAALDDEQHPLLGLRQEDLVGRHPRLALGHSVEVHVGAGPRPRGHLGEGAGQAGRAHVLDPHHRAGPERLEARLEEELLGERVAHLDGGAPLGRGLVEGLRRHRRPVDAVAARLGADVDERVPHPVGPRPIDAVRPHQAQAQDVHQRVPRVLRREGHLAPDGRASEAVAVVGDPGDDPAEKEPGARLVDRSEAERVEERDGAGAHREDVAEDAAHPRRRALERLDERRVVVALDLEGEAEPAPDVHDAGVLARALEHVRALRREAPEVDARGLVRAVLGPERGEEPQLRVGGIPPDQADDAVVLLTRQPVGDGQIRGDLRLGSGHGHPRLSPSS